MKKLLYYCSYVPDDMLKRAGFEMKNIHELSLDRNGSNNLPGSPCSFIRYCCDIPYEEYDGVIFANCCNSSQRMYDYVKHHHPNIFVYIMEVPRDSSEKWDCQGLISALKNHFQCCVKFEQESNHQPKEYLCLPEGKKDVVILSSALHQEYRKELKNAFAGHSCRFISCGSEKRGMRHLKGERVSCPRMLDYFSYVKEQISQVRGVILISTKNCDPVLFAFPDIQKICLEKKINYLMIEEEYGTAISSRSRIRYEAFLERLEMRTKEK